MDLRLNGRVAIVTGSSRGLGLVSPRALAAERCRVVLCGRTEKTLHEAERTVSADVGSADHVMGERADVSRLEDVEVLAAHMAFALAQPVS